VCDILKTLGCFGSAMAAARFRSRVTLTRSGAVSKSCASVCFNLGF
jgi:hypothetical protein